MRLSRGQTKADAALDTGGASKDSKYAMVIGSRNQQGARAKRYYCPLGVLRPIHLFFT